MKRKKKGVSLLLCLVLMLSLVIPGTVARATDGDAETPEDNGLELSKTATRNPDGTYKITLEAYATGSQITTSVTEDVPTDIILVLDQSGSMDDDIGTVSFEAYPYWYNNADYYELRHNGGKGNLYYAIGDGKYASVSVQVEEAAVYKALDNPTNSDLWEYQNRLYVKIGGEYVKVTVSRSYWTGKYTYEFAGKTITSYYGSGEPDLAGQTEDDLFYAYEVDKTKSVYTYTYSDASGGTQTFSSTGASNAPEGHTLYERSVSSNGGGSRLEALKTAVTTFADSVATKAKGADGTPGTEDDINHRIAVVGFASDGENYNDSRFENTELFIGGNQYKYNDRDIEENYGKAFQDMNVETGVSNVNISINALDAYGGTRIHYGMEMANNIFASNPIENNEKRNRVIVVFTDGMPGNGSWFDNTVANSAISQGYTAKNTYSATIYTVGIFSGADATSAGSNDYGASDTQKANWFMQNLSSNDGKVQDPSYYLSAADAETLNNIFEQISDQISTGGSTTTLDENAVIKDVVSDSFQLPDGMTASDVTVQTSDYTAEGTWADPVTATGVAVSITERSDNSEDQVTVTGFDFSENWCGPDISGDTTTYRGKKLIISFDVEVRPGFMGGNGVPTNGTDSAVYQNSTATEPVEAFKVPTVDISIQDVAVTAQDYNVYLLGGVESPAYSVTVKDVYGNAVEGFDLSKANENYGLEPWQTAYVSITATVPSAISNLTEDTTYSAGIGIEPTTGVTAENTKTASATGSINVFKPVLTFQDGTVDYKSTIADDKYVSDNTEKNFGADNYVSSATVWKHGETVSSDVSMTGLEPRLDLAYGVVSGVDSDGVVTAMDLVPVNVDVKIGDENVDGYTTFIHSVCDFEGCEWDDSTSGNGDPAFLLHVINTVGDLTIQKTITEGSVDQSFLFVITCEGNAAFKMEVIVPGNGSVTIKDLPSGNYTVTEITDWSWRYDIVGNVSQTVKVGPEDPTVTFRNMRTDDHWLDGSDSLENVFDAVQTATGE